MSQANPDSRARPPAANILVVDDTPANLQVLAGMLKDAVTRSAPFPAASWRCWRRNAIRLT